MASPRLSHGSRSVVETTRLGVFCSEQLPASLAPCFAPLLSGGLAGRCHGLYTYLRMVCVPGYGQYSTGQGVVLSNSDLDCGATIRHG